MTVVVSILVAHALLTSVCLWLVVHALVNPDSFDRLRRNVWRTETRVDRLAADLAQQRTRQAISGDPWA